MSDEVLNLGIIRAVQYGTIAPLNLKMLWYDENIGIDYLKYYNKLTSTWDPLINPSTSVIQTTVDLTDIDVVVDSLAAGVSYTGILEILTDGNQVSVTLFTNLTIGSNVQGGGFTIQIPSSKLPQPQIPSAYSSLLVIKDGDTYPVGGSMSYYGADSFISLAFSYSTVLDGFISGSVEIVGTISYIKKQ